MTKISYDNTPTEHDRRRLESIAQLHNPDTAAEHDRIKRDVPDEKIPLMTRLAMGYSDSARKAAEQLDTEK